MDEKVCTLCKADNNSVDFPKKRNICKPCVAVMVKSHYEKNKESIKKKKNNAAGMKKKKTPQQQKDDMDIDVEVVDLTGDDDSDDDGNKKLKAATTNSTALQKKKNAPTTKRQPKSVAVMNGGKAAASRFNNNLTPKTLDQTHPNVKVPEKLSNKTKEEQVMRCANRVKPHVMAVDTLLRVLTSVRTSPDNPKFRVIDRTNGNYIKYVRDVTGAEDLLLAMNYRSMLPGRNELRLERHLVDSALLYLGISSLIISLFANLNSCLTFEILSKSIVITYFNGAS